MPRRGRIHYVSLRSSLVNLPISIYGPLLERGVRPQGLAVHLTQATPGKQTGRSNGSDIIPVTGEAYLGWTGMVSASSLAHFQSGGAGEKGLETVEIDPQLAQGLGFAEGDIVEIGLLHDLGYATSVATEPLTADDWEILELHASHVESTMLSQVRVAMVGQEIDVWVLGRTRVRLRVVSVDPPSSGKALLLTTSTEVSIAPKTRSQNKLNGSSSHSAVSSKKVQADAKGAADANVNAQAKDDEGRKKKDVRFLRHLPPRVMPPVSPTAAAVEDGSIFAIGFVSRVLLNALSGTPLYAEPKTWTATVRRIPPPPDPLQEDRAGAASAPAAPRILNPTDPNAPKASSVADEPIQRDRILVTWWPEVEVPDDHIVLHGSVGGIEEWDIVRVEFEKEIDEVVTVEQSDTRSEKQTKPRAKLAGVDDIMKDCNDFCRTTFIIHANTQKRINGVPGLLITGRSGSGKTSMLRAVAKASQESPLTYTYTLYVDLAKYTDTPVSKIKGLLKYWFTKASWHKPSVIVMDNLDKLMSVELEHAESFRTRHITELFLNLFGSANRFAAPNARGILLLASAESTAAIHPRLNTAHVFREVIHLKPPGKDARRDILANIAQTHIDASDLTQDPSSPLNFTALATQTEGFSATDLKDLVARAVHRAAIRVAENEHDKTYQPTLRTEDFTAAQMDFVPLSLRDVKLQKSDIAWSDIGGLRETKRILRETLEWPTKYGPIFAQSPLRLRSGLLLYGFPGCGKTLLASAVAKECGLNFISVKGPELLNKYIGASEQSVRELFERASAAKPCVLFFDEFDSIAPKRGHDSTGVTDRVVNQMLTQMDGAEGLDGVYVLAATSRPDLIDSALLRPGRLDKSLLCNMPDEQDRKEILEAVSRKVSLSPSINLDETARDTEGFSGADLQALIYNAQLEVIHETIASTSLSSPSKANGESSEDKPIPYTMIGGPDSGQQIKSRAEEAAFQKRLQRILSNPSGLDSRAKRVENVASHEKREISEAHIRKVLETTRPSVPPQERDRLSQIYRAFVSDRSGEQPMPPDAGGVGHRVTLM